VSTGWIVGTGHREQPYHISLYWLQWLRYVCRSEKIHYKQVISVAKWIYEGFNWSCYPNKLLTSMCAWKKMANISFLNAWTDAAVAISLLPQWRWKMLKKQCWNCTARDQTWKMVIQYLMWDVVGGRWHYTLPRTTPTAELQESAIPQLKRPTLRRSAGMLLDIPLLALRPYALPCGSQKSY